MIRLFLLESVAQSCTCFAQSFGLSTKQAHSRQYIQQSLWTGHVKDIDAAQCVQCDLAHSTLGDFVQA